MNGIKMIDIADVLYNYEGIETTYYTQYEFKGGNFRMDIFYMENCVYIEFTKIHHIYHVQNQNSYIFNCKGKFLEIQNCDTIYIENMILDEFELRQNPLNLKVCKRSSLVNKITIEGEEIFSVG